MDGPDSPVQAALHGFTRGAHLGLVLGILWGCWEEKKFVLRNCLKELHLRECPTKLFNVMRRSVTTAPVVATFMGVHAGLRCWCRQQGSRPQWQQLEVPNPLSRQPGSGTPLHQPVLAGAAGTAAGAVRTLLSEAAAAARPALHAQRSVAAGLAVAGLFTVGGWLEREREQLERLRKEQWGRHAALPDGD